MSLIERAADMLGRVSEPERESPPLGDAAEALAPHPIERAVNKENQRAPVGQEGAREFARKDGGAFRTLKINSDLLRQQNIITPEQERTPIFENFRRIKRHILANVANPDAGHAINLVMITSALPGEGKTFCTINLAMSIAMEMDRTVLLVDADVARPYIISTLGVKSEVGKGLMDVLLNPEIELPDVMCRTNIEKLTILPSGSRHARATEVLASERMRLLLEEMAERYRDRVIIFDSPPLLAASEASVLASHMGQILVVVEAGRTTEVALKEALSRIESKNVLGVILNKGGTPGPGYYGAYDYGYGYG
jgi:protein-tyrosine kinase